VLQFTYGGPGVRFSYFECDNLIRITS